MSLSPTKVLIKNASVLMSGTVVAQFVTFSLSFLLTRIYQPNEFGRYSIFMGCAGVLAGASTGAFDRVILLARTSTEARKVASLTLVTSACGAIAVMIVGACFGLADGAISLPLPLMDVILFLPVFMFSYACAQVFIYSSLRADRAHLLSLMKMAQSSIMGLVQFAAAGIPAVSGLILGNVAGWLVLAVAGLRWRLSLGFVRQDLKGSVLFAVARRNVRFPRYIMPNEVIDNLSNQAPLLLIGSLLTLADAGHYGLAIMILSAPSAVIGQAVGQSFLQYLGAQSHDPAAIRQLMYRVWLGMAGAAIVPFGLIFAQGERVFSFAFGANWAAAGSVAQALALLLFVRFVSSPTSTIYLKLSMQREQWYFCLAAAVYRTAAYSLAFFKFDLKTIIWVHVVVEVFFIVIYNLTALRRLGGVRVPRTAF